MLRFDNVIYLYFLALIPVFTVVFLIMRRRRKTHLKRYGEQNLISRLYPDASVYKPSVKFTLLMIALFLVIVGTADPQIGTKLSTAKREGVDVVVCLDVSNSMLAEDVKPNRLDRAKEMVSRLIDKLQGDRIALIVFAGDAFVQLPLTTDYGAAKLFLSIAEPTLVPTQGTAIGKAINLADETFKKDDKRKKALIIITDGENHQDNAVKAAEVAARDNFVVHTIGMGTLQGGPIPIYQNGTRTGFMKDDSGNVVVTHMDPQMLEQIATAGGGKFIIAGDSDPDLSKIVEQISHMQKNQFESKLFSDYEDRFQYFIAAALLFLVAEVLLSEKKNKWLTYLNLFATKSPGVK